MGSYGHDSNGFNVQNVRELTTRPARWPPISDQQRPEHRWKQEVLEHVVVSGAQGNLSARLRDSSKKLEETARQVQETSVAAVESSLTAHLSQLQGVISSLATTKAAVAAETAGLGRAARRLRAMLGHLERQLALNANRAKARLSRPPRERTLDSVSAALGAQEALLVRLAGQLRGALAGVEAEAGKLRGVAGGLDKDLDDKMLAHEVDAAVLGVPRLEAITQSPATPATLAPPTAALTTTAKGATATTAPGELTVPKSPPAAGRSTKPTTSPAAVAAAAVVRRDPARAPYKTPFTWSAATQRRVDEANVLVGNAQRMRAAARKLLTYSQEAARMAEAQVDSALSQRASDVGGAAAALQTRLAIIAAERQRAEVQRESLRAALADTEAPLAQLQARVVLRGQRPDGELVEDGVEAALTAEALALHAATTSLANKLAAVEEAIQVLDISAAALTANLEDKAVAAELEGRVAALDGRRSPGLPRTPSLLSVATADSVVSAMTALGPSASRAATPSYHHQQQQQQDGARPGTSASSPGSRLPQPCVAALSQAGAHGGDAAPDAASCAPGARPATSNRPRTAASMGSTTSSVRSSVVLGLQQQLATAQAERAALQQQLEALKAEKGLGQGSTGGSSKPVQAVERQTSPQGQKHHSSGSSCASVASRPMTTAALARLAETGRH